MTKNKLYILKYIMITDEDIGIIIMFSIRTLFIIISMMKERKREREKE